MGSRHSRQELEGDLLQRKIEALLTQYEVHPALGADETVQTAVGDVNGEAQFNNTTSDSHQHPQHKLQTLRLQLPKLVASRHKTFACGNNEQGILALELNADYIKRRKQQKLIEQQQQQQQQQSNQQQSNQQLLSASYASTSSLSSSTTSSSSNSSSPRSASSPNNPTAVQAAATTTTSINNNNLSPSPTGSSSQQVALQQQLLSQNTISDDILVFEHVKPLHGKHMQHISCGFNHVLALQKDGTACAWGTVVFWFIFSLFFPQY